MVPSDGRRISPRAILAAGYGVFLIYAFPGYPSWDGLTQLAQARLDVYTDDHPPAMAVLWHVLEHGLRGMLPMLLAQSVPFLIGVYKLLATRMSPRAAAIAAVLILWYPPVGTVFAAVFKDALMAAMIFAGVPLVLASGPRRRALGLALICVGTAMRYNALLATLPLIVLLYRYGAAIGWRRYALALVAWIAVTGVALETDKALVDVNRHYWFNTHALMDIADTLNFARDYTDAEVEAMLDGVPLAVHDHLQERMRTNYQAIDYHHLSRGANQIFLPATNDTQRAAISRAWKRVLLDNPAAYLEYRWNVWVVLTRLDHQVYYNTPITFVLRWHEDAAIADYDVQPSRVQQQMLDGLKWFGRTHFFDPYPYAILAVLLTIVAIVRRDRLASAVVLSGVIYEGGWFILAPTGDFRYSQWMVTTTIVAAVLLVADVTARRALASPRPARA